MEDVPIPTANPVKVTTTSIKVKREEPEKVGTLKNFFLMMPLACILLVQGFFLGKAVGGYSTLPVLSVSTYILLAKIAVLILLVHLFLRSITYSTAFGAKWSGPSRARGPVATFRSPSWCPF